MLGAVGGETSKAWNVHGYDNTTLTASLEKDTITWTATVPRGSWFGLGFGHNGTRVMNGTDIIFFDATWVVDKTDPTKFSSYGTIKDAYADVAEKVPTDITTKVATLVGDPTDSTKN